jgi:hypothetical protein
MGRYINIFVLLVIMSFMLFMIFSAVYSGGLPGETEILTFGSINVILLSIVITLLIYLIELMKRK